MNLSNRQPFIGVVTLLSGLLAVACMIAGLIGVNYNFDAFSDPLLILTTPGINIQAARWSMILDMFGYYLLLLPVIYLLHDWIKTRSPWSNFISFCGLAYVLVGAIGASILAVVWPSIIAAFASATVNEQAILKADFKLVNDMVYGGMWNLLEMFFAGLWWSATGFIFIKNKYRLIGALTLITGIFSLADGFSGVFQVFSLHEIALNCYLFLAIVWAIALGMFLLKKRLQFDQLAG